MFSHLKLSQDQGVARYPLRCFPGTPLAVRPIGSPNNLTVKHFRRGFAEGLPAFRFLHSASCLLPSSRSLFVDGVVPVLYR